MDNFYQKSENIGNDLFVKWAQQLGIFSDMQRQSLMSRVDWICTAKTGQIVNCELKVRDNLNWKDIFIEPGKLQYLITKWNEDRIVPLFINMCGDLTYVFDLRHCRFIDKGYINIWDKGAQQYKQEKRYAIPTECAYKYKNGKRILENN